jgi:hypothetical protein
MNNVHESDAVSTMSASDTIVPRTTNGAPGSTATLLSNSDTNLLSGVIVWETRPICVNANASRCKSQNWLNEAACGPSWHTARAAMKNGDDRNNCVLENTSTHVPWLNSLAAGFWVGL